MRLVNCQQRSAEWFAIRAGRPTASGLSAMLSKLKNGHSSQKREDYKLKIVAELRTNGCIDSFVNPAMQWGTDHEDEARQRYQQETGNKVDLAGFVLHPQHDRFGCSPDGLVIPKGGVEFKCPQSTTHIEYLLADCVPEEYQPQMFANMLCCEADWWDFVSYDPRFTTYKDQYFCKRLERDEKRIAEIEAEIQQFLVEVDDIMGTLGFSTERTSADRGLDSSPSPELEAAEDMRILEASWKV